MEIIRTKKKKGGPSTVTVFEEIAVISINWKVIVSFSKIML